MISTHPDKIVDDTPPEQKKKYDNYSRYGSSLYDSGYDWDSKLNDYYNRNYDECCNCGALVKKGEGIEDDVNGYVFCDEMCEEEFKKYVKEDIEGGDQ
jgi:hypothetical protein